MKITSFTRAEHKRLSMAIAAALKQVGDEFGVDLLEAGGQYGENGHVKIGVRLRDVGNGMNSAQAFWIRHAKIYGLDPSWFGQTIILDRTAYEICGLKPNSPKYTVQIKRCYDNKVFGTTVASVQRQLTVKAAAA